MSYRLYLFDADGTLRRCTIPGQPCPNRPGEWELLPGVVDWFAVQDWQTARVGIVSNQAGVALGYLTGWQALALLQALATTLVAAAPGLRAAWPLWLGCCCHHWAAGCACRKPAPGLLQVAMAAQAVPPAATIMIGDQASDQQAAAAAGCAFAWADGWFGRGRHHDSTD